MSLRSYSMVRGRRSKCVKLRFMSRIRIQRFSKRRRNPGLGPLNGSFVFLVCLDAIATYRTKGSLFMVFMPGLICLVLPWINVQVISLHFSLPARWRATNSDLKPEA